MPSSLYLFGPQAPGLSNDYLIKVSASLRDSVELAPLARRISTLTQDWHLFQARFPNLAAHSAPRQLQILEQLVGNPQNSPDLGHPRCLFDSCLTILLHAIQLLDLDEKADFKVLNRSVSTKKIGFQGFCIGLLSAVTASSSSSRTDFIRKVYRALLCAACIGSIVDKDQEDRTQLGAQAETISVRRSASVAAVQVEELLWKYPDCYISCITDTSTVTVTVPSKLSGSILEQLHSIGCITRTIGLKGRFHSVCHQSAIQDLSTLVEGSALFNLDTRSLACQPVRPNSTSNPLERDQSKRVIESILGETADWKTTVVESTASFGRLSPELISVGPQNCVPRLALLALFSNMRNQEVSVHASSVALKENASISKVNMDDTSTSGSINNTPTNGSSSSNSVDSSPTKTAAMDGHQANESSTASKHDPKRVPRGTATGVRDNSITPPMYHKIAVVGMSGRFAKADNLATLWERLCAGQNSVSSVPQTRFKSSDLKREPKSSFWGNFLDEPDRFDHKFFGITSREAKSMDPQQRILLEVAYDTLSSAGYFCRSKDAATKNIGCYVGVGSVDYDANVASHDAGAFSATGTLRAFVSGKVSHHFGWTGPSITCDTACSSSAVAIHSACMALQMGECSEALAGGVNIITDPALYQNLAAASFLSPSGPSKAFDASADGYCRGEGAGLVLLKPLDRAIIDGDDVIGVISGSAVNQGSNCSPITVPDSNSQRELYLSALARANVLPSEVSYVECHGTGTPVGDPIEFESIQKTFTSTPRQSSVFVGSIKDAIGHCEGASGIAGVLKVLLMMQHHVIPKQANFVSLNPRIKTSSRDCIEIPTKTEPWPGSNYRALVNNYGAAGSNAAILLEQAPLATDSSTAADTEIPFGVKLIELPFCISGRTSDAVIKYSQALQKFLLASLSAGRQVDLRHLSGKVCSSQNPSHEYTWTCVAASVSNLVDLLSEVSTNSITNKPTSAPKPVILCFPGQNGLDVSLDKNFVDSYPLFKKQLVDCDAVLQLQGLPSLFPRVFESSSYEDVVELHCSLFAVQYSSAMSWIASGLKVDRMIGHSFGQLTAMCVGGCVTLHDAIKLVSTRARLINECLGHTNGIMISVECGQPQLNRLLADVAMNQDIDVACHNSPRSVVLAGPLHAIEALESSIASSTSASAIKLIRLKNSHAYHSHIMEQIKPELLRAAQTINYSDMKIPIETCTKDLSWDSFDADRVVEHSRNTVYFSEAVQRISEQSGPAVWIDVGTASPLSAMIQRNIGDKSTLEDIILDVDLNHQRKMKTVARMVTSMWAQSVHVKDWSFWSDQRLGQWLEICPYPFEKTRSWLELTNGTETAPPASAAQPVGLLASVQSAKSDASTLSFLLNSLNETFRTCTKGHAVLQQSLCPASMYVEMIAESIMNATNENPEVLQIRNLSITKPLGLSSDSATYIHLTKSKSQALTWDFDLASQAHITPGKTGSVTGRVIVYNESNRDDVNRILISFRRLVTWSRITSILASPDSELMNGRFIYKAFGEVVDYASYYQGVVEFAATEHEAVGRVRLPASPIQDSRKMLTSPIALDNFLQVAGIHINCWRSRNKSEVFMCTEIQDIYLDQQHLDHASSEQDWLVYACIDVISAKEVEYDIFVLSAQTEALTCVLKGVRFFSVNMKAMGKTLARNNDQPSTRKENSTQEQNPPQGLGKTLASLKDATSEETPLEPPQSHVFEDIQALLSEVMDIEADQVGRETGLDELGVDSLMVTEVLGEIQKRLRASISMEQFQTLTTVQNLCDMISSTISTRTTKDDMPEDMYDPKKMPQPVPSTVSSDEVVYKAQRAFYNVSKNIDKLMDDTKFAQFYQDVYPLQAELVARYVVEAFTALGQPVEEMQPGDIVPPLKHLPQHGKVMRQIHHILVDYGLLSFNETSQWFVRTSKSVPKGAASTLQAEILDKFPQHRSEHELLQTTAANLCDCLTGEQNPTSLIFGSAKARTVLSDVYANAPMFKAGTILLANYLQDILRNVDPSQEMNILEIGAGTGGTTSLLLGMLSRMGRKLTYTFTDLSSSLVIAARKKFQAYPFMRYQTLNIEVEPAVELLGKYDVIISTNCIHATKSLVASTAAIQKMLRPDGILCLVELTRNLFWFDLVFGLLDGWWLFNDGRKHVIASEAIWKENLKRAGYDWIEWSQGTTEESNVLRVITASPSSGNTMRTKTSAYPSAQKSQQMESLRYKAVDNLELYADVHYPIGDGESMGPLPVALLIHGGGHVLLSRKSFSSDQIRAVVSAGFIAVSVDYRLCPESTLPRGAMIDVRDALKWIRTSLPIQKLARPDIQIAPHVVAAGWSTGGHLAMTLAWTSIAAGIQPPEAIMSLYCPTDYEDDFWRKPNIPKGSESAVHMFNYRLIDGTFPEPVSSYVFPSTGSLTDGWMAPHDARSRIPLHMNWHGQTLQVLLRGMDFIKAQSSGEEAASLALSSEEIQNISPLRQIQKGNYKTPTYIIHGTDDDLIPYQQSQRTFEALQAQGVDARLDLVHDAPHLFDVFHARKEQKYARTVQAGIDFLRDHI